MEEQSESCYLESSCSVDDVHCIADTVVYEAICTAKKLIREDPEQLLLYPTPGTPFNDLNSSSSEESELVMWVSVEDFTLNDGIINIRDFINLWELSPSTKFVLEPRTESTIVGRGRHISVDALFSKPTPQCPNPLAVANVHFAIHVSALLPAWYPIMVTYCFEGYKTQYYALGKRCPNNFTFQRFYIDTIMHMKLSFYAKICECAHPIEAGDNETEAEAAQRISEDVRNRESMILHSRKSRFSKIEIEDQ